MVKSQTATEYLIILAVVIIIALIVIGTLGGIPGIGGGATTQTNSAALTTLPVGIISYAITNQNTQLVIRNNLPNPIDITSITINNTLCQICELEAQLNAGSSQTITCGGVTLDSSLSYSYSFSINYTDMFSNAQFTQSNAILRGTSGVSTYALANGSIESDSAVVSISSITTFTSLSIDSCDNKYMTIYNGRFVTFGPTQTTAGIVSTSSARANAAVGLAKGYVVVAGDYLDDTKYNAAIWSGLASAPSLVYSINSSSTISFEGLVKNPLGGYFLSATQGSGASRNTIIYKFDASFNQLWNYSDNLTGADYGSFISADSNLICMIRATNNPGHILCVNQSGQKEWNATWGDSTFWSTPFSIVVSADGVYASGENVSNPGLYQHMASKHSRTGTNLWQRVYFSTNGYNRVPRVFLDSRSNLFLSAMTDETNSSSDDIIVARIDASSGSMLWNRSYGTVSDDSRFYAGFGVADTSGDLFTIINSTSTGVRFARFGTTPGTTALSWS